MNESASSTHGTGDTREAAGRCAVLLLDARGRIVGANATAVALWRAAETDLVGAAFAALFAFEVVSDDPEFLDAQWEALLAGANTTARLTAQPRAGAPCEVAVRLEKLAAAATLAGAEMAFIATVQPPAETAPATADDGFRLLADRAGAGFFDLDLRRGRAHYSAAWKRLLGYAAGELADTLETWEQLIHPDDSAAAPHRIGRRALAGERPFNVEFRLRHQRGHWMWCQCIGVQVIGGGGELERVVGIQLDITERKELEDALVANDARLQDLCGAGPLAAFELDFTKQLFWFSPAFETLLGYGTGELAPELASFAAVLPPDEAAAGVEAWLLARSPGASSFIEPVRLRNSQGQLVPVMLGAHRTVSRRRELLRVVGFAVPVAAEALAPGDGLPPALAHEAFATVAEGVVVTDARGRVLFANPAAARLLRVEAASVRAQPVGDVMRLVNRQSLRPADDPFERALTADRPLPLISEDALAPAADGEPPTPIVWTARAAFAADGKMTGVVIVFRNPDEMTLSPEELVKANRFESLGLLAGGIAHDFNNLLTTILGGLSLAHDNRDYSGLDDALKACEAAKGLTKQLLAFAKGGTGTQTVVAPKALLSDAVKIAAAAADATVSIDVPDTTHGVMVDRPQLLQVFQNLVVNALQAMPPPPHRPRVQLRAANVTLAENQVPGLRAGDYVEFEVRDNGSGIRAEHVERIFDPFFTTKKHGTGLGLATVLSIVRKHGGQVGLDTQVGVGTVFTVYLPKAEQAAELQPRRAPSLRFGTGRVLFMDDDPMISALTATMLQSLDYKYDLAKTGEEAIALYKRYLNIGRPYDAVIMDLTVVGGMGGEECFNELRKLDPDVRAIVASGYDNDDMRREFYAKGFLGYLTKPYRVGDLGKVLKAVLG